MEKQNKKNTQKNNKKNEKKSKKIKIGKYEISKEIIGLAILFIVIAAFFVSPKYYSVTTGLYNKGTIEDQKNVETAMGKDNTEERFLLYFQWYNVIHELGHGLLYYNDGVDIDIADEEQLVNDFAVAYWKYYGEEDKVNQLYDIVNYAVVNVGDNYKNGVDYLKLGKENSTSKNFYSSFFNFNDYGWFQFSSVKHSFEENKDLETVLKEMGFKDFKLTDSKVFIYDNINEDVSDKIINDAVNNFNEWGLKFPKVVHKFDNDPNNNYSKPIIKYFGLIEMIDFKYIFDILF